MSDSFEINVNAKKLDPISDIVFEITYYDIMLLKPDWDEEKCSKFLSYIEKDLLQALDVTCNQFLEFVLNNKNTEGS